MIDGSPYQREFLEYINQHLDIEPIKAFEAITSKKVEKELFFLLGDVFLYPEFLVFLTVRTHGSRKSGRVPNILISCWDE